MDFLTGLARAEQQVASFDSRRVIESPLTDIAVAVVLSGTAFVAAMFADYDSIARGVPLLVTALLATAPQAVRRDRPWASAALVLFGSAGAAVCGAVHSPVLVLTIGVSVVLSYYTVLRRLGRWSAWLVAACVSGASVLLFLDTSRSGLVLLMVIVGVAVTTALIADMRRSRTEVREVRADNLETLRKQAAMAERARIAREMHDIVAHSVSMIAVQAETAPYTLKDLDDQTKREFADIASSARNTLTEMRRLLGVLRADVTSAPETAPQPGLALLPELVEHHDGEVDLDVVGEEVTVPHAVDVSAYRIVQEALTNARIHAPGARVSIELTYRPALLVLRITDDGPGPSGDTENGHGLVGMRERALALGGWFEAGPGPAGGFLIHAGLPLE
ncbi:histidine kinase [Streptosporangium sp. NPDC023825]|uniref:sensor histidine kinase n=1 Tax=Streptosporangium sp. NPDC023825 TaxID=3154909 RepID=UPI0034418436